MDLEEDILSRYRPAIHQEYTHVYTIKEHINVGDVWSWILSGDYRDKDFKWNNRTFYFKSEHDLLMFLLRWS